MSIRRTALEALTLIVEEGAYANLTLKKASGGLSPEDARFLFACVYGVLDNLTYIDHVLAAFTSPHKNRYIRNILRLGAHELLKLRTPAHAAVSESVELCREIGKPALTSYVNGVLRAVSRGPLPDLPAADEKRLSVQYSCPEWLAAEWISRFGVPFTESLLSACPAGQCIRPQYPCTAEELLPLFPGCRRGALDKNALYPAAGIDVSSFPPFLEGKCTVQGEGAMLICRALGDVRGMKVLDACAAPGGKSAYLWSLSRGEVDLTCMELHPHRVELMQKTFDRLHVAAKVLRGDAAVPDPALHAAFGAVLLDVPCSGLGLLSEKPDLKYKKSGADILSLARTQEAILHTCSAYVKPGGVLVYATCTVSKAENEDRVETFLRSHPEFTFEKMPLPAENDGQLQLFPHIHGTGGFYMARMKKCI